MSYPTLTLTLTSNQYWGKYGALDLLVDLGSGHYEVVIEEWYVKEAAARGFAEAMHIRRPFS